VAGGQEVDLRVDVIDRVHDKIRGAKCVVAQDSLLHLCPVHCVERLNPRFGANPHEIFQQASRLWHPDVLSGGQTVPVEGRQCYLIKIDDAKPTDAAPQQHVGAVRADPAQTNDHDERVRDLLLTLPEELDVAGQLLGDYRVARERL
jgi:hypothetical protein